MDQESSSTVVQSPGFQSLQKPWGQGQETLKWVHLETPVPWKASVLAISSELLLFLFWVFLGD